MTDKELSAFGERLYGAIMLTPLPSGTIFALATAIRQATPWSSLPPTLKLAVYKIASNCAPADVQGLETPGPSVADVDAPEPCGTVTAPPGAGEFAEDAGSPASEAIKRGDLDGDEDEA